jgi:hypothetical protein
MPVGGGEINSGHRLPDVDADELHQVDRGNVGQPSSSGPLGGDPLRRW